MYPQVFGKYVLERELSRGGMARVVLATLRGAGGFEKKLVVKQIRDELSFDQQFIRRFVEEAKTTVALSHPNIVPVYELGVEQGTYFLAMELVEGCSIAELVRERGADGTKLVLSPEEGAYVGMEVCRALDYAHRRMKVVHRDITPRNVMLDEEGQVKLIDFGIAAPALVAGHEILGSPGHMPPEQVEGKELGPPTDIFAVAALLMEAWSGVAPFRRATPEECDEAMRRPHPRPSDYDPRLIPVDDVIIRAMKLDPRERQQDAADVARALRAFLQGTDVTDIARELGNRVRDMRQAASEPSPMSIDGKVRAPNPSVGDLGTQTFAAREEAIRWSSPPASEIEPPGASTRRLLRDSLPPSSEMIDVPGMLTPAPPLPQTPLPETPVSQPPGETPARGMLAATPKDPAMSIPTPLMIEPVGALNDAVLRSARAAQDAARAARDPDRSPAGDRGHERGDPRERERADTLATRPIETPVRSSTSGISSDDASKAAGEAASGAPRSRTWMGVALAAVVIAGAGFAWRASSGRADVRTDVRTGGTSSAAANATAPGSSLPAGTAAAPLTAPAVGVGMGGTGGVDPGGTATSQGTQGTHGTGAPPSSVRGNPHVTVPGAPHPVVPASAGGTDKPGSEKPGTERAGRALVSFLGDPGTRVSVDGVSRGWCPARVSLEPGQHDVRFQFDPTGESRGERFSVKANERVTVRAEFTGASPTVRIQR